MSNAIHAHLKALLNVRVLLRGLKITPRSTFSFHFSFIHPSILLLTSQQVQGTKSSSHRVQQLQENTQEYSARTGARLWVSWFPFGCASGQDFFLSFALPFFLGAQRSYSVFKLGGLHWNRFVDIWLNLNEVVIVYEMSIESWVPCTALLNALEKAVTKDRYTSMPGFPKNLLFFCFGFWHLVWEEVGLE